MEKPTKRVCWDAIVGIALVSLLGWGVWTTTKIYDLTQCDAVAASDAKGTTEAVKEVKTSIQAIDKKIEEQNKTMKEDQKEMYKILLDIQKQIKDNNKKK